MNARVKIFISLNLILFCLISFGQGKHGFIDYDSVFQHLPNYCLLQTNLKILQQSLDDSLNIVAQDFYKYINRLPHGTNLDSITKKAYQDSINNFDLKIQNYQDWALQKYNNEKQRLDGKLRHTLIKEIKNFCLENDIQCIADKKSILYCMNCTDFTKNFIDYLRKN